MKSVLILIFLFSVSSFGKGCDCKSEIKKEKETLKKLSKKEKPPILKKKSYLSIEECIADLSDERLFSKEGEKACIKAVFDPPKTKTKKIASLPAPKKLKVSFKPENSQRIKGSYFDFISTEYKNILKWECPVSAPDKNGFIKCIKPDTFLRDNDEFNVLGLTSKANPDCHHQFYKTLFNASAQPNGLYTIATTGEAIVKRCYYRKYFSPFKEIHKCLRPLVFDIGVLSGQHRAKKQLQKALGVKADGKIGPKTLAAISGKKDQLKSLKEVFINYLKQTKFKGKSLWYGWERKNGTVFGGYKNGWTNRVNWVFESAEKNCQ